MSKVLLKYGFIFDPNQMWATQDQFETDLGKFFASKGFKAELIETAEGQEPLPIIYLTKSDEFLAVNKPLQFSKSEVEG